MKEKLKGKNSFYYDWFNITTENYSMYSWKTTELEALDEPCIKEYATEFKRDIDSEWSYFKKCLKQYPNIFPYTDYNKELYIWCFEYVMTRCYGWSLKYTSLVPFADSLNHHVDAVEHFICDPALE